MREQNKDGSESGYGWASGTYSFQGVTNMAPGAPSATAHPNPPSKPSRRAERALQTKGKPMIFTNPDGSRFYVPDADGVATAPRASAHVREFLREIGKRGGQERARRHTREELASWGG